MAKKRIGSATLARSNTSAIKFFKRMGYGRPEAEVWMSKVIQRTRKLQDGDKAIHHGPRKKHVGRHRKVSRRRRRKSKR